MSEPVNERPRALATWACAVVAAGLLALRRVLAGVARTTPARYASSGSACAATVECAQSYSFDGADESCSRASARAVTRTRCAIKKWREMGEETAKLTSGAFAPMGWVTFVAVRCSRALGLARRRRARVR